MTRRRKYYRRVNYEAERAKQAQLQSEAQKIHRLENKERLEKEDAGEKALDALRSWNDGVKRKKEGWRNNKFIRLSLWSILFAGTSFTLYRADPAPTVWLILIVAGIAGLAYAQSTPAEDRAKVLEEERQQRLRERKSRDQNEINKIWQDLSARRYEEEKAIAAESKHRSYVVYWHEFKSDVCYVGIGKPSRPYDFESRNGLWLSNRKLFGNPKVIVLARAQTYEQASKTERRLIAQYGRIGIDSNGILINEATGG